MSDDRFDCIIVGGGLAGLTAAYVLAGEGLEVLLVEKGNYSGAKNVTGGRLYGYSLDNVIPGFAASAPVERRIVKERLSHGQGGDMFTVEYASAGLTAPTGESYAVLRGVFDRWLADQAEEQGAMLVYGVRVDELLVRDGQVCGVIAGEEEMEANVVILADGVNSLISQKLGYKEAPGPGQVAVGAKEVIGLSGETINSRLGLAEGEGLAWMFSGCGQAYDGFLYTNKDSVSVGITMLVKDIDHTENNVPQMLEDFKNSPQIAPLLEGGKLLEYSAHMIPEGGAAMLPKLYGNGVLLTGDAAALCANLGFTLRGMDLAIESGHLAAQAVLAAREQGDYSEQTLAAYQAALEASVVLNCVKGAEACLAAVKAGGFKDDPLAMLKNVMKAAGIQ
jgi:electron transfer flavoprotein-quinone oxidoreductase